MVMRVLTVLEVEVMMVPYGELDDDVGCSDGGVGVVTATVLTMMIVILAAVVSLVAVMEPVILMIVGVMMALVAVLVLVVRAVVVAKMMKIMVTSSADPELTFRDK